MRVLVCGGRDYNHEGIVRHVLDHLHTTRGPIKCLIHGAASGADTLGSQWASALAISQMAFPAQWSKYGRAAGPRRNQKMIDEGAPNLGVAFPGGRGTANMVTKLRKARIEVIQVSSDGTWI